MHFILLSALCSVSVAVLLKLAPRWRLDMPQLVMWNYLAAGTLCWFLLSPPLDSLAQRGTPGWALTGLALVMPSLFLVLAASVRVAGIVRTDVAQRLSLLLSLVAAFTLFGEQASTLKLLGLALGLAAIAGIVVRPDRRGASATGGGNALGLLLVVWAGFALVDVMLKLVAQSGTASIASLQVVFVPAYLFLLRWQLVRLWRGRVELDERNLSVGLVLCLLNFGNSLFCLLAHQALPYSPAVVFAAMNIGVVVLGTLVGVFAFGEKT